MNCSATIASGVNKGSPCSLKAKANGLCGKHSRSKSSSTSEVPNDVPYSGDSLCQGVFASGAKKGTNCDRKAYYYDDCETRCGVHSDKETRKNLTKKPVDLDEKQRLIQQINNARNDNAENGTSGYLILFRMGMMKPIISTDGYLNVFPNYRHAGRTDGLGLTTLSPMNLGPVEHNQPGVPDAKTIEGFHQWSKCFENELNDEGNPGPLFYENLEVGFATTKPERRKYKGKPCYFVWVDKQGEQHQLDYVTSRQFYCNFYERLLIENVEFKQLKELYVLGTNIQICGYDAYPIPGVTVEDIEREYLNDSVPFGHERVLYSMLVLEEDEYPWRKHKTFDF